MNEAIRSLYQSVEARLPAGFSFADFERAIADWEVIPVMEGGEVIGAVMVKGNELHVGFSRQGACIRGEIKRIFKPLLQKFGELVTTVCADNKRGLSFCKRLGFEEIEMSGGVVKMRCTGCKYA
ncbi:hypothetical protein PBR31_00030 [Xanthomonas phage PBR31]|uniref:Uncharacterized protein n=1 Tax=Xanthomonas phage PPDBI TaxID=2723911 RepID=A0A6H0X5S7_9CAUD|nr:hypothetical protein [Ralstonia pickettii]NYS10339.1 hypothetical protein [Ralstonia pickettii]QIN95341.1 hypothetical protein PBR31_00030 [Xanthomonas phage PBR31]QIW89389.1 hypothetical protein PPDBI_00030 [Xanthomonas phage PPDBI]